MQPKTIKLIYWIATIIFALLLVMDGIGGIMRAQAGQDSLAHLGYPLYLLPIMGWAKLFGAIAILQTRFRVIKEWAFAGFAFTCYGAFCSRLALGDDIGMIQFPVIFLAIMLVPYFFWKKLDQSPTTH